MNENLRRDAGRLPIFRSEAQYRILGELYTNPGREATVGELSESLGVPHPTVSREVKRLVQGGMLQTRARGRQTLVSAATDSPVFEDLRNLLGKVYGVVPVLREEFAGTASQVVVFGSWAARWRGEPGAPPRDIDVLVVTDAPAAVAWDAAARATRRLGLDVNVVVRTAEEWARDDSGFAQELQKRPSVVVELPSVPVVRQSSRSKAPSALERRYG